MPPPMPSDEILAILRRGVVIPASPLALDADRKLDLRHQRAIYTYYMEAGAGGIAVGVHTTQFEIRDPEIALFQPLLESTAETISSLEQSLRRPVVKIAGVCGKTPQAVAEARLAASLGYDAGLLSLAALSGAFEDELIDHCRAVSREIPLIGFYLQAAIGGPVLSFDFWRHFAEIENVIAIKIAPFNRHQTIDVVRAVGLSSRADEIALYTGNDDAIIADLITPHTVVTPTGRKTFHIRGGLLGQWCVWTRTFVRLLDEIHALVDSGADIPADLLRRGMELTDANAAVFDAANGFAGCIPGINEVLRRQGLLATAHCLDPSEILSPGQSEELDRVMHDHPWLLDDEFVLENLERWLGEGEES